MEPIFNTAVRSHHYPVVQSIHNYMLHDSKRTCHWKWKALDVHLLSEFNLNPKLRSFFSTENENISNIMDELHSFAGGIV